MAPVTNRSARQRAPQLLRRHALEVDPLAVGRKRRARVRRAVVLGPDEQRVPAVQVDLDAAGEDARRRPHPLVVDLELEPVQRVKVSLEQIR